MGYLLNAAYLFAAVAVSPWLFYRALTTGKYRRGLWRKLTGAAILRRGSAPCAWFHGVSVGEIHMLTRVVEAFRRRHPDWHCVVSTTTDTGYDEARKRFPDVDVFYWPLDFTWAVRRALRAINPSLVVLAESEIWPNFVRAAHRRGTPVVLINARMSPRSFRRARRVRWLVRPVLRRLGWVMAQTPEYADAFQKLGAEPGRLTVTGSIKYDGVCVERRNPRTDEFRRLLGVTGTDRFLVAGSTQDPEERILLTIFHRLKVRFPSLRLILVPRQRDRFEAVARDLEQARFVRRSSLRTPLQRCPEVVLVDTIGELSAIWGLAEVAFVGGSLDGKRGGQNMIEPAAYGAAVVFGPHVWNFRETARRLVEAEAAIQVEDAQTLESALGRLLGDREYAASLGSAARRLVLSQQGATERTLDALDRLMVERLARKTAA